MIEAKIFKSGNSLAIRLPKEYHFDTGSVRLGRIGNLVVLIPKGDPWKHFSEGVQEAREFPSVSDRQPKKVKIR